MLKILVTIGWRNLWRNKRRSLIMLAALTVGVWSMIWMTAMMRGMVEQMVDDSIQNLNGHIRIHASGFRDDPSISNSMSALPADLLQALDKDDILHWGLRLRLPAMLASERHSLPITIIGMDPDMEAGLSFIMNSRTLERIEGRMLADATDRGIIIGQRLMEKLESGLGKRVVLMSQDYNNQLADRGFRIVGVYKADMPGLENRFAFVGLEYLQDMLQCTDCKSEISILGKHHTGLEPLQQHLSNVAGELEVLNWMELDPYAKAMLKSANGYVYIIIVVIFIALSFGLVNTLVMAIYERQRELALLHALGLSPAMIALQILLEALFLVALGLFIGNQLAFASLIPVRDGIDLSVIAEGLDWAGMSSILKPDLWISDIIMANLIVLVLGLLACLLPAWQAARKAPAAALNRGNA